MSRRAGGATVVGHRERMRDHAVLIQKLLQENRRISLARIAEEIGASEITVRRWIDCFSCVMPLRLERGIVIVEKWDSGRRSGT
jgi:predicted DNA-binding transcriptional regulator YafY